MARFGALAFAFVAGGLSAAVLFLPALHKRMTVLAVARDLHEVVDLVEYGFSKDSAPIDCWGDSLTEGKGLSRGHDFPHLLSYLFHRRVVNRGVSGETSQQIKARMLSRPAPAAPENAIIWAGRNDDLKNIEAIEGNIADMVNSLAPRSHFLVLGVLNGDTARERRGGHRYAAIVSLNDHLSRTYGKNFVPVRDLLVPKGSGNDEDDARAVDDDVVPPSLRLDALHLNDQGEAFVAYAVEAAIKANGW